MIFKVAIFTLNQWALDFKGNSRRILESIDLAKEADAAYRAGPELEICGYSLEDAFYEEDTLFHSWTSLLDIIQHSASIDMIIDLGMPVRNVALYNCRVILHKGKILCIRAKTSLAREGNYREYRHFTPWEYDRGLTSYKLPSFVSKKLNQEFVPFGADFILELDAIGTCDTFRIGWEICQELWDVKNVSSDLYQKFGCHLIVNGSASYWELRKLNTVTDMIRGISLRGGACYAFSNLVGCDGQRYVLYGRSCIFDKGKLVALTPTCADIFREVQMITYCVSPRDIDEYRAQMGIQTKDKDNSDYGRIWDLEARHSDVSKIDSSYKRLLLKANFPKSSSDSFSLSEELTINFLDEIHLYVPLWLWDYLRRSKMAGFMMPLSGGLDSSTVLILVYAMCGHIFRNLNLPEVKEYFLTKHRIADVESTLNSTEKICRLLLKCCYLSTRFSSIETRRRAAVLAQSTGAEFVDMSFDSIYSDFRSLLKSDINREKTDDGDITLLDQNLQARLRMAATYYLSGGNRIVLATGNVDEGIMGYLTKYDCSSADINPIGGLCKNDLKSYLNYCCMKVYQGKSNLSNILKEIVLAPPSAELTGAEQRDEDEIGITYDEISVLGRVRRGIYSCSGPRGAFEYVWRNRHREPFCNNLRCFSDEDPKNNRENQARSLGKIIKRFYNRYARNRHKLTVLTPALHAETYSPDDNRFDHRHFLYAPWDEQFNSIDQMVEGIVKNGDLV